MEIYSHDDSPIQAFFDHNPRPTRQECNDLARSLLGGQPVKPFIIQGQFSHTVYAAPQYCTPGRPGGNAKIVQSRLNHFQIDIQVAQLAKAVHTAKIRWLQIDSIKGELWGKNCPFKYKTVTAGGLNGDQTGTRSVAGVSDIHAERGPF